MINKDEYLKAYVELYEVINRLPIEDKSKIPEDFIQFLKDNMDNNYTFTYDSSKSLFEQNVKVETKALLVNLYQIYLAKPEEKEFWDKYNKECIRLEEEQKIKSYNSADMFKKKNDSNN